MIAAQKRFAGEFAGEGSFALAALPVDNLENYVGEVVYIDSTKERLLEYLGSEMPSMENFHHRRIEY